MAERNLGKFSTSLAIREIQIKTTLRFHLIPVRMAKIKNTDDSLCWRGCGVKKGNALPLLVGVQTCTATLQVSMAMSKKIRKPSTSRPSNTIFAYMLKGCSIIPQGHVHNYVHSSMILNSQNLETTSISLN